MRVPSPEPPEPDPDAFELQGMLTITLRSVLELTEEVLLQIGRDNAHLRFEVDAEGDLVIMAAVDAAGSARNARLTGQLFAWADRNGTGEAFDSSAGFRLRHHAVRGPDASWVRLDRLQAAAARQPDTAFLPVCPDFVVELRSRSDRLAPLEAKMREYIASGAQLGWLIDPIASTPIVQIYRPGEPMVTLTEPISLAGDPVLPGFVLDLQRFWQRPRWHERP